VKKEKPATPQTPMKERIKESVKRSKLRNKMRRKPDESLEDKRRHRAQIDAAFEAYDGPIERLSSGQVLCALSFHEDRQAARTDLAGRVLPWRGR